MKKKTMFVVTALSLVAGFSASTAVFASVIEQNVVYSDPEKTQEVEHVISEYKTNSNGQTYGSGVNATYIEDYPVLMSVVGDNGNIGYVYTSDYLGELPTSPAEAVKIQESIDNGTYTPRTINVYESDGTTIIDTFTETLCDKIP
jgi:hypothetical protein